MISHFVPPNPPSSFPPNAYGNDDQRKLENMGESDELFNRNHPKPIMNNSIGIAL
jgi:hypothetical protein